MPYIQITKCIAPADYNKNLATATTDSVLSITLYTLFWGGFFGTAIAMLLGVVVGLGVGVAAAFCAAAQAIKDTINNKRLVCIKNGKDKCIIGIVMPGSIEPPGQGIDNDYCFNLMPLPHNVEDDRDHVIHDGHLGELFISDPPEITAIGLSTDPLPENKHHNNIHCELEGDRPNVFADALCVAGVIIGAAIAAVNYLLSLVSLSSLLLLSCQLSYWQLLS
jgi:hypothetical protein